MTPPSPPEPSGPTVDLVLSSGFLSFARQAGFLQAVEDARIPVDAVVGTSSGALAGALWCAGLSPTDLLALLAEKVPLRQVGFNWRFWRGLFTFEPVIRTLEAVLPPTFADLPRPFAVGVRAPDGSHRLVREGPLARSVAASCAIPWLFAPVELPCGPCQDGGVLDRLGLAAHRRWRGARPVLAHWVDRTMGTDVPVDESDAGITVVRTPRSGARFWDLGDVEGRREEARLKASAVLSSLRLAHRLAPTPAD